MSLYDDVQDVRDRIDELEQGVQEGQDQDSQSIDDVNQSISDFQQFIEDNQDSIGQLKFPLTTETVALIKEIFPFGSVDLVGGIFKVDNLNVGVDSIIIISRALASGPLGNLSISAQVSGSFTILSDDARETSTINYLILNP